MRQIRWARALRLIVFAVFSFALVSGTATAAHADEGKIPDGWNQDEWKRFQAMPQDKKDALKDEAIAEMSKTLCGNFVYYMDMGNNSECEAKTRKIISEHLYTNMEQVLGIQETERDFCGALAEGKAPGLAQLDCNVAAFSRGSRKAVENVILGAVKVAEVVVEVVKFIADPKTALDNLANDVKSQSVEGTQHVLNSLTSVTGLDANSSEYRSVWAIFAGIGVVVMTLMMLVLFRRYGEGKVSDDSFGSSMTYYLPIGFLLAIFGPGLMGLAQGWSSDLSEGSSGWAAGVINDFVTVIAQFGAMQSTGWFGSLAAILFFGLLLLGAFSLLLLLLLTPYFMGFAGLTVALLWGLSLIPSARPRLLKVGSVAVMMIFFKPLVFVLVGGAFSLMATTPAFKEGVDGGMVNIGNLLATGLLLVMLAASPVLLFKLMPVLDADDVPAGAGGSVLAGGVAGAVAGGAAQSFASMRQGARERRRAAAESPGGRTPENGWGGSPSSGTQPDNGQSTDAGPASVLSAQRSSGTPANGGRGRRRATPETSSAAAEPSISSSGRHEAGDGSSVAPSTSDNADSHRGTANKPSGSFAARGKGSSVVSAVGTPIKSGLVGALYAGRESARSARRAAADFGQMPSSWGNFKGTPHSKEME